MHRRQTGGVGAVVKQRATSDKRNKKEDIIFISLFVDPPMLEPGTSSTRQQ